MFAIKDPVLVQWGIGFLCSIIVILVGVIVFLLKWVLDNNRSEHTETRLHSEKTDEKLEDLLVKVGKIQILCKERSRGKYIDGKD